MKIYKYLSFESALKTLDNNSVLLNSPLNYNDPFDCIIQSKEKDKEECYRRIVNYFAFKTFAKLLLDKNTKIPFPLLWVRWELGLMNRLMRKNPYYDGMPGFDLIVQPFLKNQCKKNETLRTQLEQGREMFLKTVTKAIGEIRNTLLVSCFSKTNKSILMWSHYAEKHQGVCIEFEVEAKDFYRVRYSKKRKQLDLKIITAVVLGHDYIGEELSADNPSIKRSLMDLLLTKSKDWRYESEVRTIHTSVETNDSIYEKDGRFFLKMPAIKRVYVGCKAPKEKLKELRELYPGIEVVEMVDSDKDYRIVEHSR